MTEAEEFEFRHRLESEQAAPAQPSAQTLAVRKAEEERGKGSTSRNLASGLVRGAGSIGATILAPFDWAARKVGIENDYIGRTDRREAMDGALTTLGADTDSIAYQVGKLGGEIAGTAGVGGVAANALARIPGVAAVAPGFINAVRSGGMTTGQAVAPGAMNALGNLGTRAAGGAVTGGLSVGAVNPEDAGMGAALGGALPVATRAVGAAGNALGRIVRGPAVPADLTAAVQAARQSGYVIPPTQARPTLGNRLLEGFSGKITTAQNASAKNQVITNGKAATAIGLPADTKLTPDVLKTVRDQAGAAYDAIGNSGTITPGKAYDAALDALAAPHLKAAQGFPNAKPSPVLSLVDELRAPSFDASSAVAKIKELRSAADDAFRAGNSDVARASKGAAKALEDALEGHLSTTGNTQLLDEFRAARQLIAKTYSVEKALNPTTGGVDARKLAGQLAKGKPLSGDLKEAADFAARFPKAAQTVEGMGSLPQTSPLDWSLGAGMSAATMNPLAMAGVMARPAARAVALSPVVQNRLAQQAGRPNALSALASNPQLHQLGYQSAPVFLASGR